MSVGAAGLTCRTATLDDAELLWRWINDPATRQNSFNPAPIPRGEHVAWLEDRVGSATTRLWIFNDRKRPIGQVRCEVSGDGAEIHIAVAPECRARGYGKAMLTRAVRLAREWFGVRVPLRARVLDRNTPSLQLFKACGFREAGATERPGGGRAIIFELAGTPPVGANVGGRRRTR